MIKRFYKFIPLVAIIVLAIFIRFYQLGDVPIALNRDEASLGYTAYSLLQSGHEEHGVVWPISIESFGDWKLPVYVYALIPAIKIWGLQSWAVRLPSALAGIGVVILAGFISYLLTNNWKNENRRLGLSTLVILMTALSPWGIHLSHLAYEANLGMFLVMVAVSLFLLALQDKAKRYLLPFSALLFGLTFFTYHSYQIFTPILVLFLAVIYWSELKTIFKENKKISFIALLIAGFFTVVLVVTSLEASSVKLTGLSIFDRNSYRAILGTNRSYFPDRNSLLAKLHTNSLSSITRQAQENILAIFSTEFLFLNGGSHGAHDIPGTGKMHRLSFFFILIAGYRFLVVAQQKKLQLWHKFILAWLLSAIVAPFITFEAAHSIRFSPALFPLEFLSAYGMFIFIEWAWKKRLGKVFSVGIFLILLLSALNFSSTYFIISPKRDINQHNWQMEELTELINEKKNDYDIISFPGSQWSPYIYLLFFNQVNPDTLATDLEFYPPDREGFRHVKRLGKIQFSLIEWDKERAEDVLYVIKRKEVPEDKLKSAEYRIETSLTKPLAKDEWLLLSRVKSKLELE